MLDKQEPQQLRAAAFMVLKENHPTFTTLQMIAHSLRTEPSRPIKTLVYSSLVNLAKVQSDILEIRATYVYSHNSRFLLIRLCTVLLIATDISLVFAVSSVSADLRVKHITAYYDIACPVNLLNIA